MSDTPQVCVVIPCYNREDTVVEAVQSVLDQDYPGLEKVIAVDDASTDGTVAQLQTISDPRLVITTNTHERGASGARNHGAALSTAPWIAFQDSDDLWLPGKLAKQMARVSDGASVAVYCGMAVKADTAPETPVSKRYPSRDITPLEGDILPSLVRNSYISTQMLVVRRDVFDRLGGFDESFRALVDWELMLRVAQEGPVAFVDEDLVVQRMTGNSITRSSEKRLESQRRIAEKHHDLLARYPGVLAYHYHRIAGAERIFGRYDVAAKAAAKACKHAPGNLKYILNATFLGLRARLGT